LSAINFVPAPSAAPLTAFVIAFTVALGLVEPGLIEVFAAGVGVVMLVMGLVVPVVVGVVMTGLLAPIVGAVMAGLVSLVVDVKVCLGAPVVEVAIAGLVVVLEIALIAGLVVIDGLLVIAGLELIEVGRLDAS
jgi:hypothetical protein